MANVNLDPSVRTSFTDPLSASGYRFTVHRLPRVSFSVQMVNIPGINLTSPSSGNPFVRLPYAGDHIDYGEFRLTYLVDEQLVNYLEIHDWIRALGKPESFDQYAALRLEPGTGIASDCTLVILDSKKNPKLSVAFTEAVPTTLSDLMFDATLIGVNYVRVTATFRYTEFTIAAL